MNIYVGNLPFTITEDELKNMFSEFGEIASANIINDRYSGQSKGFGFVEMTSQEEAGKAINALNNSDVQGRNIKVSEARPRREPLGIHATRLTKPPGSTVYILAFSRKGFV